MHYTPGCKYLNEIDVQTLVMNHPLREVEFIGGGIDLDDRGIKFFIRVPGDRFHTGTYTAKDIEVIVEAVISDLREDGLSVPMLVTQIVLACTSLSILESAFAFGRKVGAQAF